MFWLIFGLIILAAGFVQGLLGFGFAVVALALLPFWVRDIHQIIAVLTLSTPLSIGWAFWKYRQHLRGRLLIGCLGGAAIGLALGLYVFKYISPDLLTRGTGVVLLAVCAEAGLRQPQPDDSASGAGGSQWGAFLTGNISGFLAGSVGLPGPPIVAYLARAGWPPHEFRAFSLAFFAITSLWRCAGMVAIGEVNGPVLGMAAVATPLVWLGHYLGAGYFTHLGSTRFRQLVYLLLVSSATNMLLVGARS